MNVAILDLGVGNLHSLGKALQRQGAAVRVETSADAALAADALVLPGVGAFGAAAARLAEARQRVGDALAGGHPCLGICLGMQLLFTASDEGEGAGLGLFPGRVRRLTARPLPHMGWNDVVVAQPDPLFGGVDLLLAYFAHSYAPLAEPTGELAWSRHGDERFAAVVRRRRTWGVQFHPEKSGAAGLRLLHNFLEAAA